MPDQRKFFSLRQWSPYQGTVQIVEVPGFRAISRDGLQWQVLVKNEGIRFFTFGTWRRDGSGNLISTDRTRELVDALEDHPALPFPAIDNLELWLLDNESLMPLALLRSMQPTRRPIITETPRWKPAVSADNSFVSSSLLTHLGTDQVHHIPHHEVLERCISAAAGAIPAAQWFRRDEDGSGQAVESAGVPADLQHRQLERDRFPSLLLKTEWAEEFHQQLVSDYHAWQAPELLTHTDLAHEVRDRLEREACQSASRVYRLRKVLPQIVNKEMIEMAFVEAMIRQTAMAS